MNKNNRDKSEELIGLPVKINSFSIRCTFIAVHRMERSDISFDGIHIPK